jgi:hypothetical protein
MKGTIPTLNVSPIKLDEFFGSFGNDLFNDEIAIISHHDTDPVRIEVVKVGKPLIGEDWGSFGLSNK